MKARHAHGNRARDFQVHSTGKAPQGLVWSGHLRLKNWDTEGQHCESNNMSFSLKGSRGHNAWSPSTANMVGEGGGVGECTVLKIQLSNTCTYISGGSGYHRKMLHISPPTPLPIGPSSNKTLFRLYPLYIKAHYFFKKFHSKLTETTLLYHNIYCLPAKKPLRSTYTPRDYNPHFTVHQNYEA